jgi:hypothetical protein
MQVSLSVLLRRQRAYSSPAVVIDIVVDWTVVIVWDLIKVAMRAAARAIHNRRAVSKDASKHGQEHGQPPAYLF